MLETCGDREIYSPGEPLRSLYVDFNSYFASVEQQVEPRLRGRPVGVVPLEAETTCCIAASYEAKRFGVRTGTPVWQARQLCPDIVLVEARPPLYVDYHHKLVAAVDRCLPVEDVRSIDEMACTLMGVDQDREQARELALKVKQAVCLVGDSLRCSIGIAPNGWLAKTASDMQKPDGLVILEAKDLPQALFPLELRDLCGIGQNMAARLHAAGISSVEALCRARLEMMRQLWNGLPGEQMHAHLRGKSVGSNERSQRQSVGHSHVLPPALRHAQGVEAVLHRLLQKAVVRLRYHGQTATAIVIKVKFITREGMKSWRLERKFKPTDCTLDFIRLLSNGWRERPAWACRATPFAAAVAFSGLVERRLLPLDLFADGELNSRAALDRSVDWINRHYGKNTLFWGAAYLARQAAPARIAFSHVPDDEYQCEPEEVLP